MLLQPYFSKDTTTFSVSRYSKGKYDHLYLNLSTRIVPEQASVPSIRSTYSAKGASHNSWTAVPQTTLQQLLGHELQA